MARTASPQTLPAPGRGDNKAEKENDDNRTHFQRSKMNPNLMIETKTTPPPPSNDKGRRNKTTKCVEGVLLQRRSRARYSYKPRYVVLNLSDGGTISCYGSVPSSSSGSTNKSKRSKASLLRQESNASSGSGGGSKRSLLKKKVGSAFSKTLPSLDELGSWHRKFTTRWTSYEDDSDTVATVLSAASSLSIPPPFKREEQQRLRQPPLRVIPASVPWVMRDFSNDEALFEIEIPLTTTSGLSAAVGDDDDDSDDGDDNDEETEVGTTNDYISVDTTTTKATKNRLPIKRSKKSSKSIVFRCPVNGNEKYLWLQAATQLNRLSTASSFCNCPFERAKRKWVNVRPRSEIGAEYSSRALKLERANLWYRSEGSLSLDDLASGGGEDELGYGYDVVVNDEVSSESREYRVYPLYAYRHRWMTEKELHEEMLLPSSTYHDLCLPSNRDPNTTAATSVKGIGTLRVEVLGCLGLPKLDRFSKSDPVVYLVCGSYAFATDVIPRKLNPIWPRKSRRACIFPLHHAYAQLFVGVFDDDGPNEKDDFAGRVTIDIATLRTGSTYDVTLPLRLYEDCYSRKKRGAVRLRFCLDWSNGGERAALFSYLDRPFGEKVKGQSKRSPRAAVNCADVKSFRNVAITVHGANLPGRFTQKIMRGASREFRLYRVVLKAMLVHYSKSIMTWSTPIKSFLVFTAWMHCVYCGSLALVPPYVLMCTIHILIRNYFEYNINHMSHHSFAPLTIEEMLMALLAGGPDSERDWMAPLEVSQMPRSSSPSRSPTKAKRTMFASAPSKPPTLWKSGAPSSRSTLDNSNDETTTDTGTKTTTPRLPCVDHMEFPFSDKDKYPKVTVDESLVKIRSAAVSDFASGVSSIPGDIFVNEDDDDDDDAENDLSPLRRSLSDISETGQDVMKKGIEVLGGTKAVVTDDKVPTAGFAQEHEEEAAARFTTAHGVWSSVANEQDIDVRVPSKKKMKDYMFDAKEQLQETSMRLFDDRIHVDSETTIVDGVEEAPRLGTVDDKSAHDLDRHLGIHKHSNPVTAQAALYIGPMVEMLKIGLGTFRSVFNVFMWKDPYLSFWTLLGCIVLVFVLVVFPWRLFFFVVGVVGVGPQNWLLRIRREAIKRRKLKLKTKEEGIPSKRLAVKGSGEGMEKGDTAAPSMKKRFRKRALRPTTPRSENSGKRIGSNNIPPEFVFHNHLVTGDGHVTCRNQGERFQTTKVQQVTVPYSPLRHNRFYDWPPDRSYARVKVVKQSRKKLAEEIEDVHDENAGLLPTRLAGNEAT